MIMELQVFSEVIISCNSNTNLKDKAIMYKFYLEISMSDIFLEKNLSNVINVFLKGESR